MSQFTDATGHTWTLDINVQTVEDVHQATNVSIYKLLDKKFRRLVELLNQPPVLAHVCYVLAGAKEAGVTQRQFAAGLKGDALGHVVDAFLEELTLFFPDARRRAAIGKIRESWRAADEKVLNHLAKETAKIDPDAVGEQVLTELLSRKSGDSPDTSESTPDP